jgi:CRISPR-associated protein Csb2
VPTLKLRFPGGRYHATPWGHHVNEGLIEWPPSPWRLLRALIACGFSSQGWTEVPPTGRTLIDKLAGVLPSYRLPDASAAHSRHFMPIGELAKGREKTTLVFDTWANVGDGGLLIHWPCELNEEETAILRQLVGSLGYLGRSESWAEVELVPKTLMTPSDFNAEPCCTGEHRGRDWEQVSLMAPIPSEEYRVWRQQQSVVALAPFPLPEGKKKPTAKLQKERETAVAPYPPDLLSCLTKDTAWWKNEHGWSQPPGSQRVLYWRRSDSLQVGVPPQPRPRQLRPVTTMLLSLTTPSGNRSALPSSTRTLPQAELFHRAIVGRVGKGCPVHCPELTGKDEGGQPLSDNHAHAHTVPVDLDGDHRLDHLIIYARMGLGEAAQRAIRTLRRTWTKGGVGDLQLAVVGAGDLGMLRRLPPPLDRQITELLGPAHGCRIWESATPFVPPRFVKARGKSTLLGQINAELASRGYPPVATMEIDAELTRSFRHHVRRRIRGGVPPFADIGFGLRLTFSESQHGPIALGYASHYGMGLFRCSAGC